MIEIFKILNVNEFDHEIIFAMQSHCNLCSWEATSGKWSVPIPCGYNHSRFWCAIVCLYLRLISAPQTQLPSLSDSNLHIISQLAIYVNVEINEVMSYDVILTVSHLFSFWLSRYILMLILLIKGDLYNSGPDEDDVLSDDDSYKLSVVLVYSLSRCDTELLCKRGVLSPAPPDGEPQSWAQAVRTRTLSPRPSHAVWPRVAQCPPLSS